MTEEIFTQAQAMYREQLNERENSVLQQLCRCAEEKLASRLREGTALEEIGAIFVTAAGMLALSLFLQVRSGTQEESSMKLGDVSIQRRGAGAGHSSAAQLRRQAELLLHPWLEDQGFAFCGVQG